MISIILLLHYARFFINLHLIYEEYKDHRLRINA